VLRHRKLLVVDLRDGLVVFGCESGHNILPL
jgi:hypothetical protein